MATEPRKPMMTNHKVVDIALVPTYMFAWASGMLALVFWLPLLVLTVIAIGTVVFLSVEEKRLDAWQRTQWTSGASYATGLSAEILQMLKSSEGNRLDDLRGPVEVVMFNGDIVLVPIRVLLAMKSLDIIILRKSNGRW